MLAALGSTARDWNVAINRMTTGEVSATFPTPFTPAGYVFSMWGVIYLGWIQVPTTTSTPSASPPTGSCSVGSTSAPGLATASIPHHNRGACSRTRREQAVAQR